MRVLILILHHIWELNAACVPFQVQEGVLESLRIALVTKPSDCSSQVKARLSKVGADLIQQVSFHCLRLSYTLP